MKWKVPYTVTWHGVATIEADTAKEAVEECRAMQGETVFTEDDHEEFRHTANEAFPALEQ